MINQINKKKKMKGLLISLNLLRSNQIIVLKIFMKLIKKYRNKKRKLNRF